MDTGDSSPVVCCWNCTYPIVGESVKIPLYTRRRYGERSSKKRYDSLCFVDRIQGAVYIQCGYSEHKFCSLPCLKGFISREVSSGVCVNYDMYVSMYIGHELWRRTPEAPSRYLLQKFGGKISREKYLWWIERARFRLTRDPYGFLGKPLFRYSTNGEEIVLEDPAEQEEPVNISELKRINLKHCRGTRLNVEFPNDASIRIRSVEEAFHAIRLETHPVTKIHGKEDPVITDEHKAILSQITQPAQIPQSPRSETRRATIIPQPKKTIRK